MTILRHGELAGDLKQGLRPVYLVHGDEPYLIEETVAMIVDKAVSGTSSEFDIETFRARESMAEDVVSSCMTVPMLSERRVVVVKEINVWKASEQNVVAQCVEGASGSTCLVLSCYEKLKPGNRLYSAAGKSGAVVEARRPYGRDLMSEIGRLAKKSGKSLDRDAVELLLDLAGTDLQTLRMQIEKLALFTGERKRISRDDVSEAIADIKLFTIFEFTDALGNKNLESALRSFRRMVELGEPPVMILSMVSRHFRIIFRLKGDQKQGVPIEETARFFKLPPGIIKRNYIPQSGKFSMRQLAEIWRMLSDLDYNLKSSPASRELAFERKIAELCGA